VAIVPKEALYLPPLIYRQLSFTNNTFDIKNRRMKSVSSFILAYLVCMTELVSSSTHHPNLRGINVLDLIDLDLDDLPCSMRDDLRSNDECVQQGQNCEAQGKHCYVISVSSGTHYICSSNEPCNDTETERSVTATTTTPSTTTPACIEEGLLGCHPSPQNV